jgi:hypothetical protein
MGSLLAVNESAGVQFQFWGSLAQLLSTPASLPRSLTASILLFSSSPLLLFSSSPLLLLPLSSSPSFTIVQEVTDEYCQSRPAPFPNIPNERVSHCSDLCRGGSSSLFLRRVSRHERSSTNSRRICLLKQSRSTQF